MVEPNVFTSSGHRYGYNGTHENDNEIAGEGNNLDFGGFGYDPRVARRWNREPLSAKYPHLAGYVIFGNNPIYYADGDGNDVTVKVTSTKVGTTLINLYSSGEIKKDAT